MLVYLKSNICLGNWYIIHELTNSNSVPRVVTSLNFLTFCITLWPASQAHQYAAAPKRANGPKWWARSLHVLFVPPYASTRPTTGTGEDTYSSAETQRATVSHHDTASPAATGQFALARTDTQTPAQVSFFSSSLFMWHHSFLLITCFNLLTWAFFFFF